MRIIITLLAWCISLGCMAAQVSTFSDAWEYLKVVKDSGWVVVSTKGNEGYFQCQNVENSIFCELPVWTKSIKTDSKLYRNINLSDKPHPEVKGAVLDQFSTNKQAEQAITVFKKYGLEPYPVYGQMQNENKKMIGTSYTVEVEITPGFKDFEKLSKEFLFVLYGITEKDGYIFDTDS